MLAQVPTWHDNRCGHLLAHTCASTSSATHWPTAVCNFFIAWRSVFWLVLCKLKVLLELCLVVCTLCATAFGLCTAHARPSALAAARSRALGFKIEHLSGPNAMAYGLRSYVPVPGLFAKHFTTTYKWPLFNIASGPYVKYLFYAICTILPPTPLKIRATP